MTSHPTGGWAQIRGDMRKKLKSERQEGPSVIPASTKNEEHLNN
jgi:hypothetical protein